MVFIVQLSDFDCHWTLACSFDFHLLFLTINFYVCNVCDFCWLMYLLLVCPFRKQNSKRLKKSTFFLFLVSQTMPQKMLSTHLIQIFFKKFLLKPGSFCSSLKKQDVNLFIEYFVSKVLRCLCYLKFINRLDNFSNTRSNLRLKSQETSLCISPLPGRAFRITHNTENIFSS